MPPAIRERLDAGHEFNRQQRPRYPHNEVRLRNNKIMDSYRPRREIVERKHTQLADVTLETAIGYLRSLPGKYAPGQKIADTPVNRIERPDLVGHPISGQHVLEVPVQNKPIPRAVLRVAEELDIIIRDVNGKEYGL